jgi:hypothetical protein
MLAGRRVATNWLPVTCSPVTGRTRSPPPVGRPTRAGLPARRARVGIGPPLATSDPRSGSVPVMSGRRGETQVVPRSRLNPGHRRRRRGRRREPPTPASSASSSTAWSARSPSTAERCRRPRGGPLGGGDLGHRPMAPSRQTGLSASRSGCMAHQHHDDGDQGATGDPHDHPRGEATVRVALGLRY